MFINLKEKFIIVLLLILFNLEKLIKVKTNTLTLPLKL
jgi:hypothetical protein